MKNLKLILLLQALVLGALTVNADDDCCPDGSEPAFDCEDGGELVCDSGDCPPCSTHNLDAATEGYKCCGGEEFDPAITATPDETTAYTLALPNQILELISWLGVSNLSNEGTKTFENFEEGKECCSDSLFDYVVGKVSVDIGNEATWSPNDIPLVGGIMEELEDLPFVATQVTGNVTASQDLGGSWERTLDLDGQLGECYTDQGVFNYSATVSAGVNINVDTCWGDCDPESDTFETDHTGNLTGAVGFTGAFTPTSLAVPSLSDFSGSTTGEICLIIFVDLPSPIPNINIDHCLPNSI
ncbi:hypothetical protein QEH52_18945 [Coraliomargarita sp. SDUM461003]|uniref:Uncharacterized protein n=1 Tax=Thalassobacterium maritimum TaxID=3041265 RepID=A0ABU1B1M8_9BACT|nr:hypothetical protein [Coraliomargarita sp. SDUM461003]MDQ8209604.1 hypothetical protein [Coraliomargarita sp. SDUM461003]